MCRSASALKLLLQSSIPRPHMKESLGNRPRLRAPLRNLPHTLLLKNVSLGAQRGKHTTSKHGQLLLLLGSTHPSRVKRDVQQQSKDLHLKPLHKQSRLLTMSRPHKCLAVQNHKRSLLRLRQQHASLVCLPRKPMRCLLKLRVSNSQPLRKSVSLVCPRNRPTMNALAQSLLPRGSVRLLMPVRDAQLHRRNLSI